MQRLSARGPQPTGVGHCDKIEGTAKLLWGSPRSALVGLLSSRLNYEHKC